MAKALPRKALIAISSYYGAIYPNGKRTGLFFTETLHPFEVLTEAADFNQPPEIFGLVEASSLRFVMGRSSSRE